MRASSFYKALSAWLCSLCTALQVALCRSEFLLTCTSCLCREARAAPRACVFFVKTQLLEMCPSERSSSIHPAAPVSATLVLSALKYGGCRLWPLSNTAYKEASAHSSAMLLLPKSRNIKATQLKNFKLRDVGQFFARRRCVWYVVIQLTSARARTYLLEDASLFATHETPF